MAGRWNFRRRSIMAQRSGIVLPQPKETPSTAPKILLIEDDAGAATALRRVLAGEGYDMVCEVRCDTGLGGPQTSTFDAVIADLKLPR